MSRSVTVVVARQECRDLWLSGRAPLLLFAYALLLSAMTYLTAENALLNFLEQREAVDVTLQVAIAVGALATLLVAADAVSGERERGTLEGLLLTPAPRRAILFGKLAAALTLWPACFAVAAPYVVVVGRGVAVAGPGLLLGFVVGTVVAVALAAGALVVSLLSGSNKTSVAVSLLVLLVLFAPTQLPSGAPQGGAFDVLLRVNPVAAPLHYVSSVVVSGHGYERGLSYLASPLVLGVVALGVLVVAGQRLLRLVVREDR